MHLHRTLEWVSDADSAASKWAGKGEWPHPFATNPNNPAGRRCQTRCASPRPGNDAKTAEPVPLNFASEKPLGQSRTRQTMGYFTGYQSRSATPTAPHPSGPAKVSGRTLSPQTQTIQRADVAKRAVLHHGSEMTRKPPSRCRSILLPKNLSANPEPVAPWDTSPDTRVGQRRRQRRIQVGRQR